MAPICRTMLIAAVLLHSPFGLAEEAATYKGLSGLKGVQIYIGRLDEDAKSCGLSADRLDSAVRIVLANSRLNVLKSGEDSLVDALSPTVSVRPTVVLPRADFCAVSLQVSVHRFVSVNAGDEGEVSAYAVVWQKDSLMTGRSIDMGRRTADETEAFAKQFLGAWLRSNQK